MQTTESVSTEVRLTFSAVHVRTADLVHQQHEDKAQDQRNADAGVKLLVSVLVFPTGAQNRLHFSLGLRHLCSPTVSVILVATCGGTGQIHLIHKCSLSKQGYARQKQPWTLFSINKETTQMYIKVHKGC